MFQFSLIHVCICTRICICIWSLAFLPVYLNLILQSYLYLHRICICIWSLALLPVYLNLILHAFSTRWNQHLSMKTQQWAERAPSSFSASSSSSSSSSSPSSPTPLPHNHRHRHHHHIIFTISLSSSSPSYHLHHIIVIVMCRIRERSVVWSVLNLIIKWTQINNSKEPDE